MGEYAFDIAESAIWLGSYGGVVGAVGHQVG